VKINANIAGWFRLSLFAMGAAYLWRSALRPNANEPHKSLDRGLRLVGAFLLSIVVIFLVTALGSMAQIENSRHSDFHREQTKGKALARAKKPR
jgi:hypothetical protein